MKIPKVLRIAANMGVFMAFMNPENREPGSTLLNTQGWEVVFMFTFLREPQGDDDPGWKFLFEPNKHYGLRAHELLHRTAKKVRRRKA